MFGFGERTGSSAPIVRFDAPLVTERIKADIRASIEEYEELPAGSAQAVYDAALLSILRGGDLHILCLALIELGISKNRAASIALYLNGRAKSMMDADRALGAGVTKGQWLWSGACHIEGHQAADRQTYDLRKGVEVAGRYTYPHRDQGCTCVNSSVITGLD